MVLLANSYRVETVSDEDDFFSLCDEWNTINADSSKGTIFSSWEWLYTWWDVYKDDGSRQLYILICKDQFNKILGIAPFQIINNPKRYFPCSRQVILLGTGETDGSYVFGEYMDLIIVPGQESFVINAFSDYLFNKRSLWDGVKFHELLDESHLSKLFSHYSDAIVTTVFSKGFRTYIDLPETYKDYLMSLRKKMRNNITRTFKRLTTEQQYNIQTINAEIDVDEAIEIVAELNHFRRGNLDKGSVFEQPNFVEFHKKIVKKLLPLNKVSLRILYFSDEPVAALYSFIDDETVHPYQSGFEEKNGHRYSLLTMMLTHEIEQTIETPSLTRFNFMYSDEEDSYKKRYSGTTETMYHISYDKAGIKCKVFSVIHGPIKALVIRLFRKLGLI